MLSKHMWWLHCTIMLLHVPTVGCAVTSNILLGFVDVTIFERGCAYCDTGNFLEKSLQRLKKRRPEVKTFLNYIAVKDRSLTAELVSKCDSIELVWSNQLGPQKKKKLGGLFLPLRSLVRPRLSWHEALRNLFVQFNTFSMRDSLPPGDLSKTASNA